MPSKKTAICPLSQGGKEFCCGYTGFGLGRQRLYPTPKQLTAAQRVPIPRAVCRTCLAIDWTSAGTAEWLEKSGFANITPAASIPTLFDLNPKMKSSLLGETRTRARFILLDAMKKDNPTTIVMTTSRKLTSKMFESAARNTPVATVRIDAATSASLL